MCRLPLHTVATGFVIRFRGRAVGLQQRRNFFKDLVGRAHHGVELALLGRRDEAVEPVAEPPAGQRPIPRWGGFNRPTDVAWDNDGNIFVADGYNNSRVVKISPDGRWLKTWGEFGKEPGQFNILHSIANDAKGNIYVADRTNRRIQVFDPNGGPVRIITIDVPYTKEPNVMLGAMPRQNSNALSVNGAPWAICITPPNAQGTQYLYSADAVPGRVYKLTLDGKVLGTLGDAGKKVGDWTPIAGLFELQVRTSNISAERHHRRSSRFFFGMLAAQLRNQPQHTDRPQHKPRAEDSSEVDQGGLEKFHGNNLQKQCPRLGCRGHCNTD